MSELTPKKKGVIREYGEALFVALVVAAFIRLFLVSVFTIPSGSMLNTIQIGDYILVNKLSYGFKLPFSNTWIYKGDYRNTGISSCSNILKIRPLTI